MGWLSELLGREPSAEAQIRASSTDIYVNKADAIIKTGEQVGKMTGPQGYRTYHEYFVGEDRGDGHFPWSCRVYSNGEQAAEKTGLAASYEVARKQAIDWAIVARKAIGIMWRDQP